MSHRYAVYVPSAILTQQPNVARETGKQLVSCTISPSGQRFADVPINRLWKIVAPVMFARAAHMARAYCCGGDTRVIWPGWTTPSSDSAVLCTGGRLVGLTACWLGSA